jgi:hypothetical protein
VSIAPEQHSFKKLAVLVRTCSVSCRSVPSTENVTTYYLQSCFCFPAEGYILNGHMKRPRTTISSKSAAVASLALFADSLSAGACDPTAPAQAQCVLGEQHMSTSPKRSPEHTALAENLSASRLWQSGLQTAACANSMRPARDTDLVTDGDAAVRMRRATSHEREPAGDPPGGAGAAGSRRGARARANLPADHASGKWWPRLASGGTGRTLGEEHGIAIDRPAGRPADTHGPGATLRCSR